VSTVQFAVDSGTAIQAILFDLDGTLIDSAPLWRDALSSLVATRHPYPPDRTFDGLIGLTTAEAVGIVAGRLGWRGGDVASDVRWVERHVCARYSTGVAWHAGAPDLVESIRATGRFTGLVTSSSRFVVEAVLADPRCPGFDVVVSGDDVAATKPAPDPYLAAAGALGLPAGACVAVEDSVVGLTSAVAAGCAVVAVGTDPANINISNCLHVATLANLEIADIFRLKGPLAPSQGATWQCATWR
jgi:HAD superfamily hydrolase (TIGR01509 family)